MSCPRSCHRVTTTPGRIGPRKPTPRTVLDPALCATGYAIGAGALVRQVRASARPAQAVSSGLERMNERSSELHATRVTSRAARRSRMNSGDGPGRDRTSARGFEARALTVRFAGRTSRCEVRAPGCAPFLRRVVKVRLWLLTLGDNCELLAAPKVIELPMGRLAFGP